MFKWSFYGTLTEAGDGWCSLLKHVPDLLVSLITIYRPLFAVFDLIEKVIIEDSVLFNTLDMLRG